MPLAGVMAAQGGLTLWGVLVAGMIGSLAGALAWYLLARWLGLDRFERWTQRYGRVLTLDHEEIERGRRLFDRYGSAMVGFGRVIPTVRSLISVPAGLVAMHFTRFMFYTTLGTMVWTTGLTVAGYLLGRNYGQVDEFMGPVSTGVIAVLFVIYLYRVVTFNRKRAAR